jgi:hypothetical protein
MRGFSTTNHQIADLASRQYGLVARRQLAIGQDAIDHRCRTAQLHRVHHGVFAVGHTGLGQEARWLAAVLACGAGAVLSHRSAATLWGIRLGELFRPDVTTGDRRRHRLITTHRARLAAQYRATHRGIPVTSPARTLVDLAHLLDHDELTRALRETMFRRLYDPKAIQDALTRRPSRALKDLLTEATVTQSMMEDPLPDDLPPPSAATPEHPAPHRRQALRLRLAEAEGRRRDRLLARAQHAVRLPGGPQPDERPPARRLARPALHLGRPHTTKQGNGRHGRPGPHPLAHRRLPATLDYDGLVGTGPRRHGHPDRRQGRGPVGAELEAGAHGDREAVAGQDVDDLAGAVT